MWLHERCFADWRHDALSQITPDVIRELDLAVHMPHDWGSMVNECSGLLQLLLALAELRRRCGTSHLFSLSCDW